MKRRIADASMIGHGNADILTIEQRRKRQKLLRELGLLIPYDSNTKQCVNQSKRFSKYYETEDDYLKDKAAANVLIYDNQEIPKELYDKLSYTKQELENNQ